MRSLVVQAVNDKC